MLRLLQLRATDNGNLRLHSGNVEALDQTRNGCSAHGRQGPLTSGAATHNAFFPS